MRKEEKDKKKKRKRSKEGWLRCMAEEMKRERDEEGEKRDERKIQ